MKTAAEINSQQIAALVKRRNYIQKKLKDLNNLENQTGDLQEIDYIDRLLSDLREDENVSGSKTVNIKNTNERLWYLRRVSHWMTEHPGGLEVPISNSAIYSFCLKFFVDTIIMNPKLAQLNERDLRNELQRDAQEKVKDSNFAGKQLSDIEDMLSYLMVLQNRSLSLVPEKVSNNGEIEYGFNTLTDSEIQTYGIETELNLQATTGLAFMAFKKARSRDKQRLKKINRKAGEFDGD